jgi:hypothetical protein
LERAVEKANAPERVIEVVLVVVDSRQEADALARLRDTRPAADQPQGRGRIRLELAESITAAELLRQRGVVLPSTETTDTKGIEHEDS